jgi:hypothetical protein
MTQSSPLPPPPPPRRDLPPPPPPGLRRRAQRQSPARPATNPAGQDRSAPAGLWPRIRAYWGGDIESPWSEAPASGAELVRYAPAGAWCSDDSILFRFLGKFWCYCVAIPMSMRHYIAAWIWQRPGRFFTVGLLVFVLRVSIGLSVLAVARYLIF